MEYGSYSPKRLRRSRFALRCRRAAMLLLCCGAALLAAWALLRPAVTAEDGQELALIEPPALSEALCTMTAHGGDYSVTVSFSQEAAIPEAAELSVRELPPESEDYARCHAQAREALPEGYDLFFCRFFDVSFLYEGQELEPSAPVDVQIAYEEPLPAQEGAQCSAVHFAESGMEVLDAQIEQTDGGQDAFVFTQESFSIVGTTISSLNLEEGSYIFYRDGYAIGAMNYGPGAVAVQVDDNGYVTPQDPRIGIERITWSYQRDPYSYGEVNSLYNAETGSYLVFDAQDTPTLGTYAVNTYARIINNVVRFSQDTSGAGEPYRYLGFDAQTLEYTSRPKYAAGDYFFAAKIADAELPSPEIGALEIRDDIRDSGHLAVSASLFGIPEDAELTFAWYRSSGDGSGPWEPVERRRVTGSEYNAAVDGAWINPSLDGGADGWYRVQLTHVNGIQLIGELFSDPYHVPYFDSLQNGSFEAPLIDYNGIPGSEDYQPLLPNGTHGMVWRTTAGDGEVEYVSVAGDAYIQQSIKWHYCGEAADGSQFVELNAKAEGSLYQDVLTVPGSTMYWQLDHRGRGTAADSGETDTLYVVIMSTRLAEEYDITTQAKVNAVVASPESYPGAAVRKIQSDNRAWYRNGGQYTVPEGQFLTRYFFVAGETAFDRNRPPESTAAPYTVGNHLDNVHFSTELPPPDEGRANLEIRKTVCGMSEDDARALLEQLRFEIRGFAGAPVTFSGGDMTDFTADGAGACTAVYRTVIDLGAADSVTVTVTEEETGAEYGGYLHRDTAVSTGGAPASGYAGTLTIRDKASGTVAFTNTYERIGMVLPATGGGGTAGLYTAGGLLTLAALGGALLRRRLGPQMAE